MRFTSRYRLWSIVFLLGGLISSCGASKSAQCQMLLNTIYENQNQRVLGNQDRAATLKNADLADKLASDIQALPIKDATIQSHVATLASGLQEEAKTARAKAELINPQGTITIRSDDVATNAIYKQVQAQEMRSLSKQQTAMGLIGSACAR
jgi:hypothetical protein